MFVGDLGLHPEALVGKTSWAPDLLQRAVLLQLEQVHLENSCCLRNAMMNGLHSYPWPGGYEKVRDLRHIESLIEQGAGTVEESEESGWNYLGSHESSDIWHCGYRGRHCAWRMVCCL